MKVISLFALAALTVIFLSTVAAVAVPNDIAIGAIRWDSWYDGAPDQKVLEQPEWKHRAPFFARYDERGKLHLDGDKEHVLHAEVAYARAVGVDYFIFGFYPDTGSWGRDTTTYLALDRALVSYLRLHDRMGVKFAISLNQLFPETDLDEMSATLATFIKHPDYMRTHLGSAPVYFHASGGADLSTMFETDQKARQLFDQLRSKVRALSQIDLTLILMNFEPSTAKAAIQRYGLDMVTAYSNFAPARSSPNQMQVAFESCVDHALGVWRRARDINVPYAPNITLGWDERPRKSPSGTARNKNPGAWCGPAGRDELGKYFSQAADIVKGQPALPFKTIVIYAWNEYTEGGWIAPTLSTGAKHLQLIHDAIGRSRAGRAINLTWPDLIGATGCPVRSAGRPRQEVIQRCSTVTYIAHDWPCPPGTRVTRDALHAPSGFEALLWAGGWRTRSCSP